MKCKRGTLQCPEHTYEGSAWTPGRKGAGQGELVGAYQLWPKDKGTFWVINIMPVTSMYWALTMYQAPFLSALQASSGLTPEGSEIPTHPPTAKAHRNPAAAEQSWDYWLLATREGAHCWELRGLGGFERTYCRVWAWVK